jgi:apolipoprotein D and lipocalin family protein
VSLLDRLGAVGYDASKLRKVPQSPDQLGEPGFQ